VLEQRMMELMRTLAKDGRSVITVTHATRNLDLCDAVVVMGEGGRLCFFGPPREAQEFFEVRQPDEIYTALDRLPAVEWQRRWKQWSSSPDASSERDTAERAPPVRTSPRRNPLRQARILSGRYLTITLRDRRNLMLLVGQVPILAAAIAALYPSNLWSSAKGARDVAGLIFLVVTLAIWVGAIDAAREIIKEKTVVDREAAVGVGRLPYLLSKLSVLGSLAAIQALVLVLVIALIRPGAPDQGAILVLVMVTACTAVAMGLVISASVGTENQAVSLIPLALIPQLLFAGQIVPYASMAPILKTLSFAVFARWSFAGAGHAADMPARLLPHNLAASFGGHFFSLPLGGTLAILAVFMFTFVAATLRLLPRAAQ
jgi:energy-coupling factor transporter ATP-binding protein EcfA2